MKYINILQENLELCIKMSLPENYDLKQDNKAKHMIKGVE